MDGAWLFFGAFFNDAVSLLAISSMQIIRIINLRVDGISAGLGLCWLQKNTLMRIKKEHCMDERRMDVAEGSKRPGKEASALETETPGLVSEGKLAYEIRLENHLEQRWANWFDGWTITNVDEDEVILTCSSTDHAGLHGVLDRILDLRLTLISVKRIPVDSSRSAADLESEDRKKARRSK